MLTNSQTWKKFLQILFRLNSLSLFECVFMAISGQILTHFVFGIEQRDIDVCKCEFMWSRVEKKSHIHKKN